MSEDATLFYQLRIAGWRQFASIEIEFHPQLTILTGANGAGKSTLLNILSSHLGVTRPFLSVPIKTGGDTSFLNGIFRMPSRFFNWLKPEENSKWVHFGEIKYTNNQNAPLSVPERTGQSYNPRIENQQTVFGFHMPSHRLMPKYQAVPNISLNGVKPEESFTILNNENYAGWRGDHTGNSILFQLKQILACWAAIGEGNSIIQPDREQLSAYRGFITILKKIIPPEVGFIDLKIQPPDILLHTKTGTFLIDAASGGLITIIEIAALIYTCSLKKEIKGKPFTVTFDEPENHLHPSLQRSLFPTLINAFPQVQFIVATHSPFMISSLKDSKVYVLQHKNTEIKETSLYFNENETQRIESIALHHVNRAGSANEILREALGVPVTLPTWVENELENIVRNYETRTLTKETLEELKRKVREAGLEELFPEALARVGRNR